MKILKWPIGGPVLLVLGAMQGCGGGSTANRKIDENMAEELGSVEVSS